MITLKLDWREVLWWMQGGMAGSHHRWSVYEDMVIRVWPQCTEQERRNIFLIMRRDLGDYWRPDGWNGHAHMTDSGEGPWRDDIHDKTPWMMFRQVLARFNPDNQYAVDMRVRDADDLMSLRGNRAIVIRSDGITRYTDMDGGEMVTFSDDATVTIRTYLWGGKYYVGWYQRCDDGLIVKAEKLTIPDGSLTYSHG